MSCKQGKDGRRNSCRSNRKSSGKNGLLADCFDRSSMFWSSNSPAKKKKVCGSNQALKPNCNRLYLCKDMINDSQNVEESQDADYSHVLSLSDELAHILARIPRSEYMKLSFVNKRFLSLLKNGEVFRVRKENGIKESSVFMLPSGESCWWTFDREFKTRWKLPVLPSDFSFRHGDKESFCAGTHLIVTGNEVYGAALWRYELLMNRWFKGPLMISPRCMFASAGCGAFAFVAGGIPMGSNEAALNSAEKYDPESKSWLPLPPMHRRRKSCSGCYMNEKFYVIGGIDESGQNLTCGEAFDENKNEWELIPEMFKDIAVLTSQSPPLVAVAENALYSIEASTNELMVYLERSNSWKKLGEVPVRADSTRGWGVAFKSLGDELLVMGAPRITGTGQGMAIYTCRPVSNTLKLDWLQPDSGENRLNHFILNCSVMTA